MTAKTASSPHTLDLRAAAILTLCCVIWGVGLVMVKTANAGISPMFNAALRSIVGGVLLYLIARWRGVDVFQRDGTLWPGILAGLFFTLEFIGLYTGLVYTSAARGVLFLHAAPFVAAAGEHILIPGHRLSGMRVLGLVAAFGGLALAISEGLAVSGGGATLMGDLLCLFGGIMWGMLTVVVKATPLGRIAPERSMLYQLAVSAVILMALSFAKAEAGIVSLSPAVVGAFLYTALLTVVFGYTIWMWMLRTYSAASLHSFTFLTPIFGVVAGHLMLGEPIGSWLLGGLALVAVGIYLVNRPQPVPAHG